MKIFEHDVHRGMSFFDYLTSTGFISLLEEGFEEISLRQMVSLGKAYESYDFWADGEDREYAALIFLDILRLDMAKAAELFEYLLFEYDHGVPTLTEWSALTKEELQMPASILLSYFTEHSSKVAEISTALEFFRLEYKEYFNE